MDEPLELHWYGPARCYSAPGPLRPVGMPFAAFAAARTTRIRIGSAVVVLPYQHPLRIAEEAAIVDILSNGRLNYGFGRGYSPIEYRNFGVNPAETRERADENLEIVKLVWTRDAFSYDGTFTKIDNVNVHPKPLQKPHPPLWVAATTPGTIKHYGAKGIPFFTVPGPMPAQCKVSLDEWMAEGQAHGFDTANHQGGVHRYMAMAEDERDSWELMQRARNAATYSTAAVNGRTVDPKQLVREKLEPSESPTWDVPWLAGTPDRVRSQVKELEAIGYKHLMLFLGRDPGTTPEENKRNLKLFAQEVMPNFRSKVAVAAT